MVDHTEIPTPVTIEPYFDVARRSVSGLVKDGNVPENAPFMERMQTFVLTCALHASSSGPNLSFVEIVHQAMQNIPPESFSEEKRKQAEEVLQTLATGSSGNAVETYSLLFGLTGDTAIGLLEQVIIGEIQKNKKLKSLLAMISF